LESLFHFSSVFLDSFTGLMPYFLLGLLLSALVEIFIDAGVVQKFTTHRILTLFLLSLTAILIPVAKGGVLPLAYRWFKKGMPLYLVLFLLTAAPLVNLFTLFNSAVAFGWGTLVWIRFGVGLAVALVIALVFSFVSLDIPKQEIVANGEKQKKWPHFFNTVVSDCFDWLPWFILGCFLSAVLRVSLPLSTWMNAADSAPFQVLTAMLYSMVLSISSTVDSFVVLNWLGRVPLAALAAFLLAGSFVDVRGLVMMVKGFGLKTTLYWALLVLALVFVSAMLVQLGTKA
jgi:uncharacterized membrane protein YraQ (UPF0718 family)